MKRWPLLCLLAIALAGRISCLAQPRVGNIRVLIVDGFSNHNWRQTTLLLRGLLKQAGGFTVDVSTMPETGSAAWNAWHPHFSDYDVVIQTCNDIGLPRTAPRPSWPEPVKQDFAAYAHAGGGVYIFHGAENAFVGWKEYEAMVGLSWRHADYGTAIRFGDSGRLVRIPPGVGRGTSHGPRGDVLVTRMKLSPKSDPIHAGMPRQWMSPEMEVYTYARGPAKHIHVLAYARDSESGLGLLWPVEWTTTYGRGRVYISTYGHVWTGETQPPSMRCAAVQTIIPRALQWLARRPVTYPLPQDFPSASAVSLRGPIPLVH